ncbi:MAG TPA: hypothetical protein VFX59_11180 [Polyangiales bacterium]|nr:hypothetical protein [Polyangiales bacterium]
MDVSLVQLAVSSPSTGALVFPVCIARIYAVSLSRLGELIIKVETAAGHHQPSGASHDRRNVTFMGQAATSSSSSRGYNQLTLPPTRLLGARATKACAC